MCENKNLRGRVHVITHLIAQIDAEKSGRGMEMGLDKTEKIKDLLNKKRSTEGTFREDQLNFTEKEKLDGFDLYLSQNGLMTEIASNIAMEIISTIYAKYNLSIAEMEDVEKHLRAYSRAMAKI